MTILGIMVVAFVFIFIVLAAIFMVSVSVLSEQGSLGDVTLLNRQNQDMIRRMRRFPYGTLLFKEATECAICLETFNDRVEIVQLKCSKYHIFHFHCIKNLLESPYLPNNYERRCPLCREVIEFQDPPVIS